MAMLSVIRNVATLVVIFGWALMTGGLRQEK
jgi:hypothetical protein